MTYFLRIFIIIMAIFSSLNDAKTVSPSLTEPSSAHTHHQPMDNNRSKLIYHQDHQALAAPQTNTYNASPNPQVHNYEQKSSITSAQAAPSNQQTGQAPTVAAQPEISRSYGQPSAPSPIPSQPNYQQGIYQEPNSASNPNNDYKSELSSLRYNLQYLADNQRLIMESLQHPSYINHEHPSPTDDHNHQNVEDATHSIINNYYPVPIANYAPPLPALPFGNDDKSKAQNPMRQQQLPATIKTNQSGKNKKSSKSILTKGTVVTTTTPATKKNTIGRQIAIALRRALLRRRGSRRTSLRRGLQQRSQTALRAERNAQQTLSFIKQGLSDALWTGIIVAAVKLAPLLLFGVKLFFKSVNPTAGTSIFNQRQGLFRDDLDMQALTDSIFASLNNDGFVPVTTASPVQTQQSNDILDDLDDIESDATTVVGGDVANDAVDLDDDLVGGELPVEVDERNGLFARNVY